MDRPLSTVAFLFVLLVTAGAGLGAADGGLHQPRASADPNLVGETSTHHVGALVGSATGSVRSVTVTYRGNVSLADVEAYDVSVYVDRDAPSAARRFGEVDRRLDPSSVTVEDGRIEMSFDGAVAVEEGDALHVQVLDARNPPNDTDPRVTLAVRTRDGNGSATTRIETVPATPTLSLVTDARNDTLAVRYDRGRSPGPREFLLVVTDGDGTVRRATTVTATEDPKTLDLAYPPNGTFRVAAYEDVDDDGSYDPAIDREITANDGASIAIERSFGPTIARWETVYPSLSVQSADGPRIAASYPAATDGFLVVRTTDGDVLAARRVDYTSRVDADVPLSALVGDRPDERLVVGLYADVDGDGQFDDADRPYRNRDGQPVIATIEAPAGTTASTATAAATGDGDPGGEASTPATTGETTRTTTGTSAASPGFTWLLATVGILALIALLRIGRGDR